MASTSEWSHFHQNNNPSTGQVATPYTTTSASDIFFSGRVSDATVVSTTISPTTSPLPTGPAQMGPEGRVSKPRRRTRASRRTPTTLLNTDTTNFRAMVQQFTGGPSNSFSSVSNFGIGPGPQSFGIGPGNGPVSGYGMQYPMGQLQYSMSTNSNSNMANNNSNTTSTNNSMFMQRMGNTFTTSNNNVMNVGLGGTGGGSSSSENRSSNNYQF